MTDQNGAPQPVTIRMPMDIVPAWALLDSAQHTLQGIANILQFMKQPELAGFIRGFATAISEKRDEIVRRAQNRVQIAQPGDLSKG